MDRAMTTRSDQPFWKTVAKHQVASLVATAVDFGAMIFLVELKLLHPTYAVVASATLGAITNFLLGRGWTFKATSDHAGGQMFRYALVSAASLGLNALGENILAERLHVQYVGARLIVAVAVSLFWNFPMQRSFVFGRRERGAREER
jgi:putative flippase GtrA